MVSELTFIESWYSSTGRACPGANERKIIMANKRVLSVEIGSSLTRVCEVDYKVKNPKIHKNFVMETPAGVMYDGELKPTPEYVREFKTQLSGHGIRTKQVVFSITSTKIASREILIPVVKENRISALVEANASDYFPVDLSEYELAHIVLETVKDNFDTDKLKVLVLAASKNILGEYRRLAEDCGLTAIAIDYSGNSIWQMTKSECREGVHMVVKMDESSSMITIQEQQSMLLQRTVSYGIDDVIETYKNQVAPHYDYRMVLKELHTKDYFKVTEEVTEEEENLREDLSDAFAMAFRGISRIFDYQNSRNIQKQVSHVYLTGLVAGIKGMEAFVSERLGVPVSFLELGDEYQFDKHFTREEADTYIACLGAALSPVGFAGIRKEEKKYKGGGESKKPSSYAVGILGGCVAASLALAALGGIPYMLERADNREKKIRVEELGEIIPVYQKYIMLKNAHNYLSAAYEYTVLPTETLVDFVEELERKMPKSLYVTSFAATKEGVTLTITVGTKTQAADVLVTLQGFESLCNVSINDVFDTRDEAAAGSVTFTVTADYVNAKYDIDRTTGAVSAGAGEAEIFE